MGHIAVGLDGSERFAQMATGRQRLRGVAAGFPQAGSTRRTLRRDLCQCGAVSYPQAGTAAGAQAVVGGVEAGRGVVRFQSAVTTGKAGMGRGMGLSRPGGVAIIAR